VRITGLSIDGFGVWSGLALERLDGGLNLLYGPNEAGKTTLLQFIRSVLYGFSPARQKYLPPLHGGRPGGALDIVDAEGEALRIERYLEANGDGAAQEDLLLRGRDGMRHAGHRLKDLFGDVDEDIFQNVFAVGLREVQELSTLGDTEAAERLYRLTAGLDRVALLDMVHELDASRRRLLDPHGGACQLVQLAETRGRLRGELAELSKLAQRYGRLAAQRAQLDRETQSLEAESEGLGREARLVELAITLRERWERRAELDAQLAALGPTAELSAGALERLDALTSRIRRHRERAKALKGEREGLRQEMGNRRPNETLWRQAPRIEALLEQRAWIETLERQVAELESEVGQLDETLSNTRGQLGVGEQPGAQDLPSISRSTIATLKPAARGVRQCRQRVEQAKAEVAAAKETAESLGRQIEDALVELGHTELDAALDQAGGRVAQLRRRKQIDERLDEMARYQSELEGQSRRLVERQVLPLPVLAGFGAVFALGVMLIVAGLVGVFVPSWVTGSMAWGIALLGAAGAGAAALGKMAVERANLRRLDACQKQIRMLGTQIEQAREERRTLDDALSPGGGPVESRLEAAERELAALEELVPLESRRTAARQDAHAAAGHLNLAEHELKKAARRWQEALRSVGLPAGLRPGQVKQLGRDCDQVRNLERRAESGREELAARRRELDALSDRIRELVRQCGVSIAADHPLEQLRQLAEAAAEQERQLGRRREIRQRARVLRRKLARHVAALRRFARRRKELLRRAGADDEQQFRQRALEVARADVLRRERDAVVREIRAALGGTFSESDLAEQLEEHSPDALQARREALLDRLGSLDSQLKDRIETRGRLAEQMRALTDDRQMARKRLELATVEKRLDDAARRWRVLAVTGRTLDSIRADYERNRQPEALREASGYLERFTGGRYCRVWTPLGEDVLKVDDAEGRPLPVEVLSRGTREQLFLSLRLALAGSYARAGAGLPLVLDDVLVNFDAARAKAAARVLRDFAGEGHQLLVFTCHEHVVKLFRTLKVAVTELPDHSEGGRVTMTVERPAAKRAAKRKPALPPPEPEPAREEEPEPEEVVAEEVVAGSVVAEDGLDAEPEDETLIDEGQETDDEWEGEEPSDEDGEWEDDWDEDGDYEEEDYEDNEDAAAELDEEEDLEDEEDDQLEEEFDEEDELEWEEEDEEPSTAQRVFDADYYDSRDGSNELDEADWDEEDEEEEEEPNEYDEDEGEFDEGNDAESLDFDGEHEREGPAEAA